jgi:hypothetical protein
MHRSERHGGEWIWRPSTIQYGVDGIPMTHQGHMGVGLWKYISKEWRVFFRHTKLDLGDGSKIRF